MPAQVKTTHTLIDRKLIVYKRGKSKAWQCRFSLDGKWFKVTTKKRDLEEAKQAATELMYEAKARLKQNLPVAKKSFRHVSALAKKRMQDELRAGTGIASYKSYLKIIDDYLPDYFDKYKITDITQAVIKGYYVHLANEMGKQPAESTIRKHNVTLNRIFDEAVANGYMVPVQVPKLQTKGLKSQKYPEFKLHEVAQIVAGFPSWIKLGSNQARREQRQLLCDYVFVLFDTGARPGKELLNLLWRQVDVKYQYIGKVRKKLDKDGYPKDKSLIETDEYDEPKLDVDIDYTVTLYVDGKTNEREVVAKNKTMLILKQIAYRNFKSEPTEMAKKKLHQEDLVFQTPQGKKAGSFNHMFEDYLNHLGILVDPSTGRNRVLYSIRSTFSTAMMSLDKTPIRDLSVQLGNSVGMIQKHYDRATAAQIAINLQGVNTRKTFFG